jgi:hypothetical protein
MNKPKTSADVCKELNEKQIISDLVVDLITDNSIEYVKRLVNVHISRDHNGTLSSSSYYLIRFENDVKTYYSTTYNLIDDAKRAWDMVSPSGTPWLVYRVK